MKERKCLSCFHTRWAHKSLSKLRHFSDWKRVFNCSVGTDIEWDNIWNNRVWGQKQTEACFLPRSRAPSGEEQSKAYLLLWCCVLCPSPVMVGGKGEGEGLCIKTTLFIYDSQEPKGDEAEWSGRNDFPKILVSLHKPTVAGRSIWWKEWVGEVLIATLFLQNFVFWETITKQNRTANPRGGELCIGETNKEIREPLRRRSSAAIEHRTACCGYTGSVGYARVIVGSYFRFFKTNMPVCAQGWDASPFKCLRWKSYTIVCNCIKQGYFVVFHHPLEQWFSTWGSWTLWRSMILSRGSHYQPSCVSDNYTS